MAIDWAGSHPSSRGRRSERRWVRFLGEALGIVGAHDGETVYAGGDDVLAMLPIPRALDCAQALSDAYRNAFNGTTAKDEATLSAAVVFAQIRLPLSQALGEARRLLDDVAKERNGRDSLAVAVLKPGGPYCEWATAWTRRGPDGEVPAVGLLNALASRLSSDPEMPGLSSALVYRIREMLTRLCGWNRWEPGKWGDLPEDIDVRAFLHAEIAHSLEVRTNGGGQAPARELTADVWHLLLPAPSPKRRDTGVPVDGGGGGPSSARAGVDALLLARFLADPEGTGVGAMIGVDLQPVDTWFFRDSTPFTMGKAPQENVGSVFPPHPATVVGAIRAALARSRGWDGRGRWGAGHRRGTRRRARRPRSRRVRRAIPASRGATALSCAPPCGWSCRRRHLATRRLSSPGCSGHVRPR